MQKKRLTKRYEELTFSDDFMFCKVLETKVYGLTYMRKTMKRPSTM